MPFLIRVLAALLALVAGTVSPVLAFEEDTVHTGAGDLTITFLGHGTLMLGYAGRVIHVDPVGRIADYGQLPKADLILLTHHHGDHLDQEALVRVRTPATEIVLPEKCAEKISGGTVMHNGDSRIVLGIQVRAVPAYNLVHKRENGEPFHPQGEGNGYVLTFGDTRVYIAGDTEYIPEMHQLQAIDIAFLPMNLPYTMTPEMAADAARAFRPKVLYPYHFGGTDTDRLLDLLQDADDIEVRLRKMQ